MRVRRRLDDDQLAEAFEMRERGLSAERIARTFRARGIPVSAGSISWACLVNGADLPVARRRPQNALPPGMVVQRCGHSVRYFTDEEDQRLLALEARGENCSQIARQLGRKPNSIRGRLATLARRQARAEQMEGISS